VAAEVATMLGGGGDPYRRARARERIAVDTNKARH
jgi:hypothetical protein